MARASRGLLVVAAAAWAQDSPATYDGRTAAEWVERLEQGDEKAAQAVRAIGAPCVQLILDRLAAGQVKGDHLTDAINEMGAQAAPTIIENLKRGKAAVRLLALDFLLLMSDWPDGASDLALALLADDDGEVRVGAALRLCEFGLDDVAAVPPLLEGLQSKEHRAWAASLLSCFPQEARRIVPALVVVSKDADPKVRRSALASLWAFWTTSPDARARLVEASESKDAAERKDAVPESAPTPDVVALCLRAADDRSRAVRKKAMETLRRGWVSARLGDNAEQAMSHPRAEVRQLACETVADGETVLLTMVLARLDDQDGDVRLAAIGAIARIGDRGPAVRKRLGEFLADPAQRGTWTLFNRRYETGERAAWTLIALDVDVDAAAALLADVGRAPEVAAVLGPRATAAIPALRKMLDAVPTEAAPALHAVTGEVDAPLKALRRELERGSARWRACEVVARFGSDAAPLVPDLAKLLADDYADLRRFAAAALGSIGAASKPAIPKLIELLDDRGDGDLPPGCRVARHAAAALAWLDVDHPKMRELLGEVIAARDMNDGMTWPGALRYFWKRGAMPVGDVVERCRESLSPLHPNWEEVLPILRLLGEIGPPAGAAVPELEELTHDRLYEVRAAAEDAIRRIRPPD